MTTLYEFFKEEAEIMGKYANGELVEVVRCKDCKQFRKKGEDYGCCLEGYGNVDGNHYCSYGERKDE